MDQYLTEDQLNEMHRRQPRVLVRTPRILPNPLRRWFNKKPQPMSLKEFSRLLGTTPSYISQLTSDHPPWPKRHIAQKIGIITRGAVTPNMLAGFSKKLIEPEVKD